MEAGFPKRRPMKSRIVEDGESRLGQTPEVQPRLHELRDSIRVRDAAELSKAGFIRRLTIRLLIAVEFRRERTKIELSPSSLYSTDS
jgi:hypothetical protein